MTETKFKRVISAVTVGAVLLLVMLLSVMVYQLFSIRVETRKKQELLDAIAYYDTLIEEGTDTLEVVQQRLWIERRARELGLIYPDDISFGK